jgi:hypothetical protein
VKVLLVLLDLLEQMVQPVLKGLLVQRVPLVHRVNRDLQVLLVARSVLPDLLVLKESKA